MRLRLATLRRQQVGAVVGDPVGDVQFVGRLEAGDDLLHAHRAIDVERHCPAGGPASEDDLAEFTDVVRVEVGEQDASQTAHRQSPEAQVLGGAAVRRPPVEVRGLDHQGVALPGADVDQEHPPAGDHRRTGPGPLGARQR